MKDETEMYTIGEILTNIKHTRDAKKFDEARKALGLSLDDIILVEVRGSSKDNLWCDRCKEEFPVVPKTGSERDRPGLGYFRLGLLYPKSKVPRRLRERLFSGGTSSYACGNCILDLMDEET
jgi:hypothetical protein